MSRLCGLFVANALIVTPLLVAAANGCDEIWQNNGNCLDALGLKGIVKSTVLPSTCLLHGHSLSANMIVIRDLRDPLDIHINDVATGDLVWAMAVCFSGV